MKKSICAVWMLAILAGAASAGIVVNLDTKEVQDDPNLVAWCNQAKTIIEQWYQGSSNLLPTKGFKCPSELWLKMRRGNKGIAWTSNDHITVMSDWVLKHPGDIGLVYHEMIHVVQGYTGGGPSWVSEGIADYMRWAIYEGKSQDWFPLDKKPRGFESSYQVTGGFFLWLETERCPGVVNRLNTALRNKAYQESLFKDWSGKDIETLWQEYLDDRKAAAK